jgi:L-lactate dehydrogenase (cytochrome)
MKAAALTDYRELARRRLPHFLFEYIDGGSYAEVTLRRNVADLEAIELRQRVLRDVSNLDLSTNFFGSRVSLPVALAPIGLAGLNARRGEVQAARAAEEVGIPFCLSTVSACALDEVVRGVKKPFWFQLYMMRDRAFMEDLLAKAVAAHCSALVFTVDMPVPGSRYRDVRSGLAGATGLWGRTRRLAQALRRPRWAWDVGVRGRTHSLPTIGFRDSFTMNLNVILAIQSCCISPISPNSMERFLIFFALRSTRPWQRSLISLIYPGT